MLLRFIGPIGTVNTLIQWRPPKVIAEDIACPVETVTIALHYRELSRNFNFPSGMKLSKAHLPRRMGTWNKHPSLWKRMTSNAILPGCLGYREGCKDEHAVIPDIQT